MLTSDQGRQSQGFCRPASPSTPLDLIRDGRMIASGPESRDSTQVFVSRAKRGLLAFFEVEYRSLRAALCSASMQILSSGALLNGGGEVSRLGAPGTNRTCGLPLRRRSLYPLSYEGQTRRSVVEVVAHTSAPLYGIWLYDGSGERSSVRGATRRAKQVAPLVAMTRPPVRSMASPRRSHGEGCCTAQSTGGRMAGVSSNEW